MKPAETSAPSDNTPFVQSPEVKGWWPELLVAQLILIAFLVLSSMQVGSRYLIGSPLVWTEELSSNLLIWMTFLGAAAIQRSDSHVRVELLEELAGRRFTQALFALFDAVIIVFLVAMVVGGIQLMGQLEYERTPAMRIPIAWVVSVVPLTSAIMVFYTAINMIKKIREVTRPQHGN